MGSPTPRRERLAEALAAACDVAPCQACDGKGTDYTWGGPFECGACDGFGIERRQGAREVWEALATRGVIPLDWVDGVGREFESYCGWCDGGRNLGPGGCTHCLGRGTIEIAGLPVRHPPTPAACVAIAADVPGVLAAEQLAAEIVKPRGLAVRRVVWRVTPTGVRDRRIPHEQPQLRRFGPQRALYELGYDLWSVSGDGVKLLAPALS